MTTIFIIFVAAFFYILFFIILFARSYERKTWNNGRCPDCGERWKYFDTDSQGGRGYYCSKCNKTIWISYNVDKVNENDNK